MRNKNRRSGILYANDDNISYGIQKFILDTEEDIEFLPISAKPGSSALVIDTSSFYILNCFFKTWSIRNY